MDGELNEQIERANRTAEYQLPVCCDSVLDTGCALNSGGRSSSASMLRLVIDVMNSYRDGRAMTPSRNPRMLISSEKPIVKEMSLIQMSEGHLSQGGWDD